MKAEIPEEVLDVIFGEEVLREIACEVCQLIPPEMHGLLLGVSFDTLLDRTVEESQIGVVLIDYLVEDP